MTKRTTRPSLEALERRYLLAGNLVLSELKFIDGNGAKYDKPAVGTLATARANFYAYNVPIGTTVAVKFTYDGKTMTSPPKRSYTSTSFSGTAELQGWLMEPGTHSLKAELVKVTPLTEMTTADNVKSLTFSTVLFQSQFYGETKLNQPLGGTVYTDWNISKYADLDYREGPIRDYHGGDHTYDGHDALDMPVGGWARMDAGVPILAAASGVVVNADDGHFDRNTSKDATSPSNFVILDHGNGWQTKYWHMKKDSVAVQIGDVVKAGTPIGLVGSSGQSTGPHLHFTVEHRGRWVETYVDPAGYWHHPAGYAPDHDFDDPEPAALYVTEKVAPVANQDSLHEVGETYNIGGVVNVNILDDDHLLSYDWAKKLLTVHAATPRGADFVTLDQQGNNAVITVNGETHVFPLSYGNTVKSIAIFTGAGEDAISVRATPAGVDVRVDGEAGEDTITIGGAAPLFTPRYLDRIQGRVLVGNNTDFLGTPGFDRLNLMDDPEALGQANFTLQTGSIQRSAAARIDFNGLAALQVRGGRRDDTLTVQTAPSGIGVHFIGGGGVDTVAGGNVANQWVIRTPNAGSLNAVSFAGVENLQGGQQSDRFLFQRGSDAVVAALGLPAISGKITGLGGTNTLDYSQYGGPVTVDLKEQKSTGLGGTFASISGMVGSAALTDRILGPQSYTTWTVTGNGAGDVRWTTATGPALHFHAFTFADAEELLGSSKTDRFVFAADGDVGKVNGGSGVDMLTAADRANGWTVAGLNAGSLRWTTSSGPALHIHTVPFASVEGVTGGASEDRFSFTGTGRLEGTLDGKGGLDVMDFTTYSKGVTVNLTAGTSSAAAKVAGVEDVTGSAFSDLLVGDAGKNTLTGLAGRDFLVGGTDVDTLDGGTGDDILVGGSTAFDNQSYTLGQMLFEWKRTDRTYAQRVALLKTIGVSSFHFKLNATTVTHDAAADTLTGGEGMDWFWSLGDVTDLLSPEKVN